jgi:hypothetical protein
MAFVNYQPSQSMVFVSYQSSSVSDLRQSVALPSSISGIHQLLAFVRQWPSPVSGFIFINQWSSSLIDLRQSVVLVIICLRQSVLSINQRFSWNIQPSSDISVILYQSMIFITQQPSSFSSLRQLLAFTICQWPSPSISCQQLSLVIGFHHLSVAFT